MASKRDNRERLNVSQISRRFAIARDRVRQLLEGTKPVEVRGQTRYYALSDVLQALKAQRSPGQDEKREAEVRRIRAHAERIEREIEISKGTYVKRDKVCEVLTEVVSQARNHLQHRLEREYPAKVAGLTPEQARIYGKRLFDEILSDLRGLGSHFEELDKDES